MKTIAVKGVGTTSVKPEIIVLLLSLKTKDPSAVNEALLTSAAANAKRKAEVLCAASGVSLGDLVNIDYNWGAGYLFPHRI